MNANFRRDYSYRADENFNGVEEGEFLRYLKYDRSTRSYLFLTGKYTNKKEKLIVVPFNKVYKALTIFRKINCIDYYPTNEYQGDFGKLITKTSQLVDGRVYEFTNHTTRFIISALPMTKNINKNTFSIPEDKDYQYLDSSWLDNGDVTARLVG